VYSDYVYQRDSPQHSCIFLYPVTDNIFGNKDKQGSLWCTVDMKNHEKKNRVNQQIIFLTVDVYLSEYVA
jgi:hypothetical protein